MPLTRTLAMGHPRKSSQAGSCVGNTQPVRFSGVNSAMGGCSLRKIGSLFLSVSPHPPPPSNSATRLGPHPDPHLSTEPSCHTTPGSERGRKALIKTHDFKLSKLSKSRNDGERQTEREKERDGGRKRDKETEGERECVRSSSKNPEGV